MFSRFFTPCLMILSLCGCDEDSVAGSRWPTTQNTEQFETDAPTKTVHVNEKRYHSVISGYNSLTKSFNVAGQIESMDVKEGQKVMAGGTLGRLYSPSISEELSQARASLLKAKSELELSRANLKRSNELLSRKLISKQQAEQEKKTFDIHLQEVKVAEAAVARLENELGELKIVAPESGVVAKLFKREGEYLNAGEPLLRFESIERQKVTFDVPEGVAITISIGDRASMKVPSINETVEVIAVEKSLPSRDGLPLHRLTYEILEPDSNLVGLRSILMLEHSPKPAYKINYRAIRYTKGGEPYTIALRKKLTKVPIELLDISSGDATILATINPDDVFLVGGDVTLPLNIYDM